MSSWDSNEEIQIFREYLRIPSVQPDIDYGITFFFPSNIDALPLRMQKQFHFFFL